MRIHSGRHSGKDAVMASISKQLLGKDIWVMKQEEPEKPKPPPPPRYNSRQGSSKVVRPDKVDFVEMVLAYGSDMPKLELEVATEYVLEGKSISAIHRRLTKGVRNTMTWEHVKNLIRQSLNRLQKRAERDAQKEAATLLRKTT